MQGIRITNRTQEWHQSYNLTAIDRIEYGKAKKFYNDADIRGNEMRPGDPVIILYFKDGSQATFSGDEYITFEED